MPTTWRHLADVIDAGDQLTIRVRGDCMYGAIAAGARVEVRAATLYRPGDVIVFSDDERLLIHRVIGLYRRRGIVKILTQADRGKRPDKAVAAGDVIGKVLSVDGQPFRVSPTRRLGALLRFLRFALFYGLQRGLRRRGPAGVLRDDEG